jgi:D-alanyl-D-alanine carboxypeptidase
MIRSCLAASLVLGLAATAPASAGTSLVIDAATGQVLSSENPVQAWHPASTTKMMTAYLALKAVREGRLGLETAIPASKRAASQPRVKVYIKAGQEITLDNALRIMMVKSANDIAYVIAEGVGGNVESFVGMMNAEAARLGMRDTHFTNPNGWHDPDQQVSARDLAVLAMALMREFPDYSDYWNTGAAQLGKQVLHNTNGLVGRYSGINGMKTGFTCASGFNVVATATRGGRTLIAVVLGTVSGAERTVKAAQLLDAGFSQWGGFGGSTLASLPAGTGGRASSICDDVRRRGGGAPLADDVDVSGPIQHQSAVNYASDSDSAAIRFPVAAAPVASPVLTRSPSGRIVLGPRAETIPVPVAFGRTPGSATAPLAANVAAAPGKQYARGTTPVVTPSTPVVGGLFGGTAPGLFSDSRRTASGNGAIPGATAFAPTASSSGGEASPLRLQGAVQPGTATATSLRPSAAASIRPPARPQPKPLLTKPASQKVEPTKAKPSQAAAKPRSKPQAANPAAKAKIKPKTDAPKPNDDA